MSTAKDYGTANRRAFCKFTRPNFHRGVALACVLALTGLSANSKAACINAIELGIAAHAAKWSAPDYTTANPLGVIDYRRECGAWVFGLSHTSSLEGFPAVFDSPSEEGYGINQVSVRYRFTW